MAWHVTIHPDARVELKALPAADRIAIEHAIEKLMVYEDRLGAPHSSAIQGAAETLRELRPRAGRSRWRAFYRRVGDTFVIAAVGPEAAVNPSEFRKSVGNALERLRQINGEQRGEMS